MVRGQEQSSFHDGLAKIAPWSYLVANARGLQCIGRCVFGGSEKWCRLKALRKISAARDSIASRKNHSNKVNACNARLLFLGRVSAPLNRSSDCNAVSPSREWE